MTEKGPATWLLTFLYHQKLSMGWRTCNKFVTESLDIQISGPDPAVIGRLVCGLTRAVKGNFPHPNSRDLFVLGDEATLRYLTTYDFITRNIQVLMLSM